MRQYETVILFDERLGQDDIEAAVAGLREAIEERGGKDVSWQPWGKRRLAYEIQKKKYAHYGFLRYQSPADVPAEVERRLRISNDVLRFQTYLGTSENVDDNALHFRNPERLVAYITDRGKIRPRRTTRFSAAEQRHLSQQIKRARILGLLPFTTVGA